jgi:hypothetical protein
MTPMEMLAVIGLRPEHVKLATEQDARDIFEVGAQFVPEEPLQILCRMYPGIMFRHAEDVPPRIFQLISREFPEKAMQAGFATELELPVAQGMLRKEPSNLYFLREGQAEKIVTEDLAIEMVKTDPLPVLRAASRWLPKAVMRDICEEAIQVRAAAEGYGAAFWSSFGLNYSYGSGPTPKLANQCFRLFTTPLGQLGQGFSDAMSIDRTNMKEGSRLPYYGKESFCVEAIHYKLEGVAEDLAADIARSCVLNWDMVQTQICVATLSDFQRKGSDYREGTWYYPKSKKPLSWIEGGLHKGPFVLKDGYSFAILAAFGTHAPPMPVRTKHDDPTPYLRITLLGGIG